MVTGSVAISAFPHLLLGKEPVYTSKVTVHREKTEPVRIALIGKGKMGSSDTRMALRVPNVKLVAVCDLYDVRLQEARREWGDDIFVTRNYQEILARKDVDAVIVGTTDHWHQRISIDAMRAGKHVYCEKPVIHKISEGRDLIKAQQQSGRIFQVGSQGMSSLGNRKAKQLVQSGVIGRINLVEAAFTSAPRRACNVGDQMEPSSIWWEQYIKGSPRVSFAPERFFCWRHWKDYGTGLAGDLFVHTLASLQYITGSAGPEKIYTTGDADGVGDTPYIMLASFDYPGQNGQAGFKVSLTANNADGVSKKWGSTYFTLTGNDGVMEVEWDKVTLKSNKSLSVKDFVGLLPIGKEIDRPKQITEKELVFVEEGYKNCHLDHVTHFFDAIRNGKPVEANVVFAVQTAAPAVLCLESYLSGKPVYWDSEKLKPEKKSRKT